MSKEILLNAVDLIKKGNYKWNLYFVKIDRRNLNPYYVYKHTFRKPSYLPDYMVELRRCWADLGIPEKNFMCCQMHRACSLCRRYGSLE